MKRSLSIALASLLCLSCLSSVQTLRADDWKVVFGPAQGAQTGLGQWSAPIYHPEKGDRILEIRIGNQRCVPYDANTFANFVNNAKGQKTLIVLEDRFSKRPYFLRTTIAPYGYPMRLGLVLESWGADVRVSQCVPGKPIWRCQWYLDSQWAFGWDNPKHQTAVACIRPKDGTSDSSSGADSNPSGGWDNQSQGGFDDSSWSDDSSPWDNDPAPWSGGDSWSDFNDDGWSDF
ncbi:MAG: hypothetical protein IJM30_00785 [Thermoguttaceae bacterium]|nr:hypothetical protein [Thermoguttaceae bacterium]